MAITPESSRRPVHHRYAPAKLKALKGRCRQTARAFWYEWREMLEQDLGAKLGRAAECFDADLGALAAHGARLAQLGAQARRLRPIATRCPHSLTAIAPQISAAAPAPIDPAKLERLSADLKSAEAALAARQSAAASAEQQRAALTAQVEAAEEVVERGYRHYMHTVKTLDLQERLNDVGFYEIKIRNAGRYDLQLPELSSPDFSYLTSKAPWLPLVHAALGADAVCAHFGCMLSFPGSAMQPWHADGPHIRGSGEESELAPIAAPADGDAGEGAADEGSATDAGRAAPFVAPVHALNVFVPLVDLTADKGPTEFVPGTQFDFDLKVASKVITVDAGSAILFDYRVKHRGLGNRSNVDRPLLYITYARPFWLDIHNFDRKRYTSLPQVEDRGSRDERMQKRARES